MNTAAALYRASVEHDRERHEVRSSDPPIACITDVATRYEALIEADGLTRVAKGRMEMAAKIIGIAKAIDANTSKRQAKYTYRAGVPWSLIHELRAALEEWDR